MMRVIPYIRKTVLPLILISIIGCRGDGLAKEETIYFQKENKAWLTQDSIGDNFIMEDNHGISYSFVMDENSHYFSESSGGYLFVTTQRSSSEYQYQSYSSNYGKTFSISLSAGFKPFGDEIYVTLDGMAMSYDLVYQTVSRLDSPYGYLSKTMTDKGYEDNAMINSTLEILDTLTINNVQYNDVAHCVFKDFMDQWEDFTVSEIYFAKNIGLVKYTLNNRIDYLRKQ